MDSAILGNYNRILTYLVSAPYLANTTDSEAEPLENKSDRVHGFCASVGRLICFFGEFTSCQLGFASFTITWSGA